MQDANVMTGCHIRELALSSFGNGKNIIFSGLDLKGPMDLQAFQEASRQSAAVFSSLREHDPRNQSQRTLPSRQATLARLAFAVWCAGIEDQRRFGHVTRQYPVHTEAASGSELGPVPRVALEMYLIRVSERHHILATFIHHVAGDVGSLMESAKSPWPIIMSWLQDTHLTGKTSLCLFLVQGKGGGEEASEEPVLARQCHRDIIRILETPCHASG